ncbi:HAUS augmin-like complex subunit 5 [Carex littledalei]|uniref:HAUS augmin-like complex subunit 5 n=1 Tax=Carex littledalei TaxID=544730 RepID=A0A833VBB4_9POAL|nr:HAUS augmin-like complex subunit 5 [Carex littledalei]
MATPEAIMEWLQREMGYPYPPPSLEQLRKICRGNMVPVWNFLLRRVRSEHTVSTARRNILVHGVEVDKSLSRRSRAKGGKGYEETERRERDLAEEEVERLRGIVRTQRKELKARIVEVAKLESERKRTLDERSNARHRHVMLEAYDQQCGEASKIFAEYQRRLHQFVNKARDVRRLSTGTSVDSTDNLQSPIDKEPLYSTVKGGNKFSNDLFLTETSPERSVRKACDTLAGCMIERIRISFPAYEGNGISSTCQMDVAKLGSDMDGEIPEDVRAVASEALRNPSLLLHSVTMHTSRVKAIIHRETEKIDIRADSELLRYKYENDQVIDAATTDASSPLPYQLYGNGKAGSELSTKGTLDQLLERQKAHVQQFLETEDALNKAAEAKAVCQKLLKRLNGANDTVVLSQKISTGNISQGNNRAFELDVLAKEREVAGLRASLNTLTAEVKRLNKLCAEWKEAEDSLKRKWKKIEEFDARRSELESIYTTLLRAIMDASAFWEQQPLAARDYASRTIVPACKAVVELSTTAKDLIERELSAFSQSLDNSLYMLPATPQASATLRHNSGTEGTDSALASVLESLEFCLKQCGSEASILEDLSKAIDLAHTQRNLVDNGRVLLNRAHGVQQQYERMANYCMKLASEQERVVTEIWLPELSNAFEGGCESLNNDCRRVMGLVEEWWEQPAATVVDWVTLDGENVGAWLNRVKKLQSILYERSRDRLEVGH